ncbi:MAG: glutamine synthetase family protein [bacterium]
MTSSDQLSSFLSKHPETRYLDVYYPDLSCVFRGKRYPIQQAEKIFKSGMMSPGGGFLLAVTGECMDPEGMGFSDGDPDEVGMPVAHTLVPAPWAQIPTAQVMMSMQALDGEPYYFEPRNVLHRVIDRFGELNLTPVVAFELEFYLLDLKRGKHNQIQVPIGPLSGQRTGATQVYSCDDIEEFSLFLDEVTTTCRSQGVETGAISAEYAPGQFEINLQHSDDLLAAADRCMMFRRTVLNTARKHGYQATFMAKPWPEQSGSGLHLHISLLDQDGNNAFDGGGEYGTEDSCTAMLYHALGGLKQTMADCMAIYAPNINSYRRFVPNIYVPVSPSWAFENRSVAFRIPKSHGDARRIEHRIAGADANPYLALAALLAGIHRGITDLIDPGEPDIGNAGEQVDPSIPLEPERAFSVCRDSAFISDYFGERYTKAYTSCKLNEYREFSKQARHETEWYL